MPSQRSLLKKKVKESSQAGFSSFFTTRVFRVWYSRRNIRNNGTSGLTKEQWYIRLNIKEQQ
eukprot:3449907-Pyramimonas_sp.AAC.1